MRKAGSSAGLEDAARLTQHRFGAGEASGICAVSPAPSFISCAAKLGGRSLSAGSTPAK
jgi:hypothetical protein